MPQNPITGDTMTAAAFLGFALPTSNTTYVPNQFFDVCLAHCSRGTVRLVGYLIRQTLGWSDEQGRPRVERHNVTYADLIDRAGISRDMIRQAIDEAIAGHFIRCLRAGHSKAAGRSAVTGLYELHWDERGEYLKDPKLFRGFFAGDGNRTYVPNQFFDVLLPNESLSVLKVVGSVTRFSIGFQNKWGHRRRDVALSFQHIQHYARMKDRKTLTLAIRRSMQMHYIQRVKEGYFDPEGGRTSRAAVYALKWLNPAADEAIGRKTLPAKTAADNRSENPTGNGQKTLPADRSENPTGIEITMGNKTVKQQENAAASFEELRTAGFDAKAARAIASRYPADRIERQLRWLDRRKVKSNRLGLLRSSIEQDWPEPGTPLGRLGEPNSRPAVRSAGANFADALQEAGNRLLRSSRSSTNTITP